MRQVYKTMDDTGKVEGQVLTVSSHPRIKNQEIKPESNKFKTNDKRSCIAHCSFRLQKFLP